MGSILNLLEVLKLPIQKEKSSDETKQVPNLPLLFNALCPILRYQVPSTEDQDLDLAAAQEFEHICEEIANTVAIMAGEGVQQIKD